jgi:type VII secretion integral membrane protein EccD
MQPNRDEHDRAASGIPKAIDSHPDALWPPTVPVIHRSALPRFLPRPQQPVPRPAAARAESDRPTLRLPPADPEAYAQLDAPAGHAPQPHPAPAMAAHLPQMAPASAESQPMAELPPAPGTARRPNAGVSSARFTVAGPHGRVDVAVPVDATLTELLPMIVSVAHDNGRESQGSAGWVLQRLGEPPLDPSRTVLALGIRDGDVIRVQPAYAPVPEAVFDDVLDAVATASRERGPTWSSADTRRFSLGLSIAALSLGVVLAAAAGPPWVPSALAAGAMAVIFTAAAAVLSRAFGRTRAGCASAVAALPYSALAGALGVAGTRPLTHLTAASAVVGCAAVIVVAVLAALAVGEHTPQFTGVAVAAAMGLLAGSVCLYGGVAPGSVAVVVLGVSVAATSLLPGLAFRIARVPLPTIPTGVSDLRAQPTPSSGREAQGRAALGDHYLTAFVAASTAIAAICQVPLAFRGPWSVAVAVVASAVLLLRSRLFVRRTQRMCCLIAGAAGLFAVIAAMAVHHADWRVPLLLPLAAAALTCLTPQGERGAHRFSPVFGRAADIIEGVLTLSLLPLCATAAGLLDFVRSLAS